MNCDRCVHAGVCVNEFESRAAEKAIVDNIPELMPKNLRWGLTCKDFKMKYMKKNTKPPVAH